MDTMAKDQEYRGGVFWRTTTKKQKPPVLWAIVEHVEACH